MQNKKNLTRGTNLIPLITGYWEQSCQHSDLIQAQLKGGFFPPPGALAEGQILHKGAEKGQELNPHMLPHAQHQAQVQWHL